MLINLPGAWTFFPDAELAAISFLHDILPFPLLCLSVFFFFFFARAGQQNSSTIFFFFLRASSASIRPTFSIAAASSRFF